MIKVENKVEKKTSTPELVEHHLLDLDVTKSPLSPIIIEVVSRVLSETVKTKAPDTATPVQKSIIEEVKYRNVARKVKSKVKSEATIVTNTHKIVHQMVEHVAPTLEPVGVSPVLESEALVQAIDTPEPTAERMEPVYVTEPATVGELGTEADVVISLDNLDDTEPLSLDGMSESEWIELAIRDILGNEAREPSPLDRIEEVASPEFTSVWFTEVIDEYGLTQNQTVEIKEQLAEYIEPLNPTEAESVVTLISSIVVTTRQLRESVSKSPETQLAESEVEELTKICLTLFKQLGLELDESKLEMFIHTILQDEYQSAGNKNDSLLSLEEGTHEQKHDDSHVLNMLAWLINQPPTPSLYNLVGRLALRFRVFPHYKAAFLTQPAEFATL